MSDDANRKYTGENPDLGQLKRQAKGLCEAYRAGGVANEWVTQMLRQTHAKVLKKYSQMSYK